MIVDNVPITVKGGDLRDNTASKLFFYVQSSAKKNRFVRMNVAVKVDRAPVEFVDKTSTTPFVDVLEIVRHDWMNLWPAAQAAPDAFLNERLQLADVAVKSYGTVWVLNEQVFADGIQVLLRGLKEEW